MAPVIYRLKWRMSATAAAADSPIKSGVRGLGSLRRIEV